MFKSCPPEEYVAPAPQGWHHAEVVFPDGEYGELREFHGED
jgi:hypothetical protein